MFLALAVLVFLVVDEDNDVVFLLQSAPVISQFDVADELAEDDLAVAYVEQGLDGPVERDEGLIAIGGVDFGDLP